MVFCISRTKSLKSFVPSAWECSWEEDVALPRCWPCFPTLWLQIKHRVRGHLGRWQLGQSIVLECPRPWNRCYTCPEWPLLSAQLT